MQGEKSRAWSHYGGQRAEGGGVGGVGRGRREVLGVWGGWGGRGRRDGFTAHIGNRVGETVAEFNL